ncbi:MAG: hypothetical protein ACRDOH_25760 [Streptosporangiaceae bacterium]
MRNLATAVTGADRLETMCRSHASSTCWMWARTLVTAQGQQRSRANLRG